jgi:hypothetical protein
MVLYTIILYGVKGPYSKGKPGQYTVLVFVYLCHSDNRAVLPGGKHESGRLRMVPLLAIDIFSITHICV